MLVCQCWLCVLNQSGDIEKMKVSYLSALEKMAPFPIVHYINVMQMYLCKEVTEEST